MTITINKKKDKFFIAIGTERNHSFIFFGMYDKNAVRHMLCRVGKVFDGSENTFLALCEDLGLIFGAQYKSKLHTEKMARFNRGDHPITYQAYDTTYDHYIKFIHFLETLQTRENLFFCYKPVKEAADNTVTMNLTCLPIFEKKMDIKHLEKDINKLGATNNCRHTAIKLMEEVQHAPISASQHFFVGLPGKSKLVYGRLSADIPFYVLPVPPTTLSGLNAAQQSIAVKLYKRMESVMALEPESAKTVDKFNRLKELYTQLIGPQKNIGINELLERIHSWKETNKITLGCLRKTFFWDNWFTRKSATIEMIEGIERDLSTKMARN